MNLANIFAAVVWMACASSLALTQSSAPVAPPDTQAAPRQSSQAPPPKTGSAASPAAKSPSAKKQTSNPKPRKRRPRPAADAAKCESNPALQKSANTPCPPAKTVVRNGGASEPAVQITGGEGAAQAQQKSTTDQLRGSTEENLKKIAGRQLTSAQQDMVSQVRQYMAQSKEAVTAGDVERGRMLAEKAQLLSDELAKPQE